MRESIRVDISRRSVMRRVAYATFFYGILRLRGIIIMPLVTRLLSQTDYGLSALVVTVVGMLWPVFALNLHSGGAAFIVHERDPHQFRRAYYSVVNLVMVLTLVGSCTLVFTANITGLRSALGPYVVATAVFVVVSSARELAAMPLQIFQQTGLLVGFNVALEITSVSVSVIALQLGFGLSGFLWGTVVVNLVGTVVLHALHLHRYGYEWGWDTALVRRYLRASLPLIPVSLSQWGLQSADSYFILAYLGAGAIGINTVAYSLASVVTGVIVVLNQIYFPTLVALWEQSRTRFRTVVSDSIRFVSIGLGAIVLGYVALSPFVVTVFAGRDYAQAALFTPLIAIAYAVHSLTQMYRAALLTIDKRTGLVAMSHVAGLTLNIVLNYLTIRPWGLIGAAVNTLLAYTATMVLVGQLVNRRFDGLLTWQPFFRVIPCIGVSAWLIIIMPRTSFVASTAAYLAGLGLYLGALFVARALTPQDYLRVKGMLRGGAHA